ncbi:DUF7261 family protein [Haloferax larsenii]|uniref:DUF7261 family protein n=1 Tax=Haloferax larsenii TaxID=302484 RepID=UPI000944BD60|nr:hypothetical protein [Haloferax larsenii]
MSRRWRAYVNRGSDTTAADRGQLVLVSGAVVAVALLALVFAHAQLAYGGSADAPGLSDISAATEDAVHAATAHVAGRYSWGARSAAVSDFRDELDPDLTRIERAHTGAGGVAITTNDSAASGWALRNCPSGVYRDFGSCVADRGVVVQERAGETTVVAVAVDVVVSTPRHETDVTLAVTAV